MNSPRRRDSHENDWGIRLSFTARSSCPASLVGKRLSLTAFLTRDSLAVPQGATGSTMLQGLGYYCLPRIAICLRAVTWGD